ncbi:reverse transcriptase domain-containing protein, partial [Tanacetum coccineum]
MIYHKVPDFSTVITQQLQNLLPTTVAQVGSQASNIQGDVRNVSMNNDRGGCSYKEFLSCNPKDYDGKGGVIVYTCWTEKMEAVQDMSGCGDNQKVKYTSGLFIASHAAYTNRFHELARLVPHLVTLENKRIERYIYGLALQICGIVVAMKLTIIHSAILKGRVLTSKVIRNGSLKKNTKKRGNGKELSRDGNVRDDNKRSRTERAFASTTNPVRKEYTGSAPKCTNFNFHHHPKMPCRTCTNCNLLGHFAKDCRAGPRMVNPLNAKNSTVARGRTMNVVVLITTSQHAL